MRDSTEPELRFLAGMLLQREHSFVVRRFLYRFLAGEMTARETITSILQCPGIHNMDPIPVNQLETADEHTDALYRPP